MKKELYKFVKGRVYTVIWDKNNEYLFDFSNISNKISPSSPHPMSTSNKEITEYIAFEIREIFLKSEEIKKLKSISELEVQDPVIKDIYTKIVRNILKIE